MKCDNLVVGFNLYKAVFVHETKGKKVLVVDKCPNIGGNIYSEYREYQHTQV